LEILAIYDKEMQCSDRLGFHTRQKLIANLRLVS
jgi:hypothetical protein